MSNQFNLILKSKYHKIIYSQPQRMSNDMHVRRVVLDRLFCKNETNLKKSTRSNAPTQSTPNQPKKNNAKQIEQFFEAFNEQCAIIHEPIRLHNHKSLKRCLEPELTIQLKKNIQKQRFKTQQNCTIQKSQKQNTHEVKKTKQRLYTEQNKSISNFKKKTQKQKPVQKILSKSKSFIFKHISPQCSTILSKPVASQLLSYQSRENSPKYKRQYLRDSKLSRYKYSKLNQSRNKQSHCTLQKSKAAKNGIKNAPKKLVEKNLDSERIKRVQSLKNINDNGIRRYTYVRKHY